MKRLKLVTVFCFLVVFPWVAVAQKSENRDQEATAENSNKDHTYIRIKRDDNKQPVALQTALIKFKATRGPNRKAQVDLIGAIHIADADY